MTDRAEQPISAAGRKGLRALVLGLAGAQALYWLYLVIVASKRINDPTADASVTLMPALLATPPFLLLSLPAAILGLADRWLILAALLAGLGAIFTPLQVWEHLLGRG
jgi:hypothetical protein